jgi:hypothetical protein
MLPRRSILQKKTPHNAIVGVPEPIVRNPGPRIARMAVDTRRFECSKVRPPPPLICLKENLPAFSTKEELFKWLKDFNADSRVYKSWQCNFCKYWHAECYPIEASGGTVGKHWRKNDFLLAHGVPLKDLK